MKPFVAALYGGIVPLIAVTAAGLLVLRLLRIRIRRGELWPLAVTLGSSVWAFLAYALLSVGAVRRGHLYGLAAVLLLSAIFWRPKTSGDSDPAPRPGAPGARLVSALPMLLLAVVMAIFGSTYLLAAAGPDTTLPGFDAPLAQASAAARSPRTAPVPGLQSILLVAPFVLGGASAAAVFHLGYLFALALLCAAAARRLALLWTDSRTAAWACFAAGSLVFAAPALALAACDARVELTGIAALAAGLFLAVLAAARRSPAAAFASLLALVMAPAAFTHASAFPGFLFLPFARAWAVIPLAATLLAVLIARYRWVLAMIVAFHFSTSWNGAARLLAPTNLALMETLSWQDATTSDRDAYLVRHLPGYIQARFLDESTPPGARIAVDSPLALAWTTRHVVPFDAWAPVLGAAREPGLRANRIETRRFSALTGRHLPVPLSSPAAEIRLFHKGAEIARQPNWRVRCSGAFDNSLLTVCAGSLAEIDFGSPVTVDEIRIHGFKGVPAFWPAGTRRAAVEELKRDGVTHLLLSDRLGLTGDLSRYADYWGLQEAGERAGAHLYALD